MASAARNSPGIIGGSCSASTFASAGDFNGKLRVKWFWLICITLRPYGIISAVEHLVQNRRSGLVDEDLKCLRWSRAFLVAPHDRRHLSGCWLSVPNLAP